MALPPGQVPVSLAKIPAGNRTITLPTAVSVMGNKLVGSTEFFTEVETKPSTDQDGIAPLMEEELPDPAAGSIAVRSPERPRGQRFAEGSLPEAGSISLTFSGPDHRAAATETVPVSDASPTLADRLLARVALPPGQVPVSLAKIPAGNRTITLPAAVSVEGNRLVGSTEFFTEVEAPVTEAPLANREATGAPAAPAAPKTSAADAVAKELATPTAAGEKARLEPPGARTSQDVGSLVPPAPTSGVRRIEAGFAAPTQTDPRRGRVAAGQAMETKPSTDQDGIAPLMEEELPDPAAGSIAVRSPERPRGQRFAEGSLPEAGSISLTFSGPDHRAAATETVPVSDASPTLANRLLPLVSTEVRLFKNAGPGELSVLLKPDLRTEIVLHLRTSEGRVEATVRCERGDFQTLNAEWGQLRESLAPQGVHLLPLVEPPSISPPRAGGPASHPSLTSGDQPPPRQRAPESLDELPLTGYVTGSPRPARRSAGSARRLLESWA